MGREEGPGVRGRDPLFGLGGRGSRPSCRCSLRPVRTQRLLQVISARYVRMEGLRLPLKSEPRGSRCVFRQGFSCKRFSEEAEPKDQMQTHTHGLEVKILVVHDYALVLMTDFYRT